MKPLRLGLCQWGVSRTALADGSLARKLDAIIAEAAPYADLLVLPEYFAMEAFGRPEDSMAELNAACDHAPALLALLRQTAQRHQIWLLGGTLPFRDGNRVINRAPFIAPDGKLAFQDKHVMTRFETESWQVSPGAPPGIFATPWGRIGVAICYDMEFPTLVRAQAEAGAWLILGPSCTDTISGFNRVWVSARARALENQCYVGICPTVGDAPWSATLDHNRGFAAIAGPIDRGFPPDGILAQGTLDEPGWVFATLDPALLAEARENGAVRNHRDWPAPPPPPEAKPFG
jgi:predicted amidohydrolase